jgi:hypothetical protein
MAAKAFPPNGISENEIFDAGAISRNRCRMPHFESRPKFEHELCCNVAAP